MHALALGRMPHIWKRAKHVITGSMSHAACGWSSEADEAGAQGIVAPTWVSTVSSINVVGVHVDAFP